MTRPHDYRHLLQRWRVLARQSGLRMQRIATADGYGVFALRSPALRPEGGIYLSAGIHGDEVAATEGLLLWAEKNVSVLRALHVLIFPCLNPYGLSCNVRTNESGVDLNRCFHTDEQPVVAALKKAVGDHRFTLSLMLHEDYEGQGLYLMSFSPRRRGSGRSC